MSYCRFTDDSHVYAYPASSGLYTCCCCSLAEGRGDDTELKTAAELLQHFDQHRAAGDLVPQVAYYRLGAEAWMRDREMERLRAVRAGLAALQGL